MTGAVDLSSFTMAAANPAIRPPSAAQGDKAPPPSPATAQLIDLEAEIAADIDATASDSTVLSQFQEIVQQAQNAQFYDVSQIIGQIIGWLPSVCVSMTCPTLEAARPTLRWQDGCVYCATPA